MHSYRLWTLEANLWEHWNSQETSSPARVSLRRGDSANRLRASLVTNFSPSLLSFGATRPWNDFPSRLTPWRIQCEAEHARRELQGVEVNLGGSFCWGPPSRCEEPSSHDLDACWAWLALDTGDLWPGARCCCGGWGGKGEAGQSGRADGGDSGGHGGGWAADSKDDRRSKGQAHGATRLNHWGHYYFLIAKWAVYVQAGYNEEDRRGEGKSEGER